MTQLDKLPHFKLKGTDLNWYEPKNFENSKIMVVIFTCNHCPYARAYIRRIASFVHNYGPKGVEFLAINPNDDKKYPEDSFENMIPMSKQLGLQGKYLRDEAQDVARAFHAERTPEIFVFNQQRQLVYQGAIDDNYEHENEVVENYLNDVLDALLNDRPIDIANTKAIGCSIKWK